jgi:hypothetical protein
VIGNLNRKASAAAEKAGKLDKILVNHAPDSAPVIGPTWRQEFKAMLVAANAWLAFGEAAR